MLKRACLRIYRSPFDNVKIASYRLAVDRVARVDFTPHQEAVRISTPG